MTIQYDFNCALDGMVGAKHGLSLKSIAALQKRAERIHKTLIKKRLSKELGFFDLPYDNALAARVQRAAGKIRRDFENFVLLGIGGSALGPICIQTALRHLYHNLDPALRRGAPRMFILDNADPELMASVLDVCDLKKTCFNVISKSGTTPETMTQFMVFFEQAAKKLSKHALSRQFLLTTDEKRGFLRQLADEYKMDTLPIPDNVGGRFSELTAVGLLPAAVSGVNIRALLKGAAQMDQACSGHDLLRNPAYLNAAIHYLLDTKKGKSIAVMMPYSNALRDVADWFRQLWAESLGKRFDLRGRVVEVGQTPIDALGATDQHSQVQLYAEGPNDKIFTFIEVQKFRRACKIPRVFTALPELDYITGVDMRQLLNAELTATEFALASAQRPSVRLILDKISAENIGGLLYLFEVQTAFAGGLYNINAFDQPGVEEGKKATAALMGRQKPEDKKKQKQVAKFLRAKKQKKISF